MPGTSYMHLDEVRIIAGRPLYPSGLCYTFAPEVPMDTARMLAEVEEEIEKLQGIADVLHGSSGKRKRRHQGKRKEMSAAARKKISDAQKARWAKAKKQS